MTQKTLRLSRNNYGVCIVTGELQPVQKCTASLKHVKIWPVRRGVDSLGP